MTDANTIHILMPTKAMSDSIEASIVSLWCQTYTNWVCDIYVQHHPSHEENYRKLAKKWSGLDPRFSWTFAEHGERGRGVARQRLLEISARKYPEIVWCAVSDSDDISYPNRLANQFQFVTDHPDTKVLTTEMAVSCCDGELLIPSPDRYTQLSHRTMDDLHNMLRGGECPIGNPSVLYRRETVLKYGYQNTVRFEDMDLWTRMARAGEKFYFYPLPQVVYQQGSCVD